MTALHRAAVIDAGTGIYFWDGLDTSTLPARLGREWVFMGIYRCEQCGRSVTILRFTHDDSGRLFGRHAKACPGGCDAEHRWLEAAP